jgi:hypothetical protein
MEVDRPSPTKENRQFISPSVGQDLLNNIMYSSFVRGRPQKCVATAQYRKPTVLN